MSRDAPDVILVEDDQSLRTGAAQALELEGLSVASFADAPSALQGIAKDYPGVVVSDVRLPGMDGIEMFDRLRERDRTMQVIFTTAHGDVDMAVQAMKSGAADFFTGNATNSSSVGETGAACAVMARIAAATIERLCMRAFLGLYLSKPFETIKQPLNLN